LKILLDLVLGIVTSIGGFSEIGSISTAAQAGSEFGYQLLWAIAIATLMLAMLLEMSGRLAAVSKQPLCSAIRARFGVHFQMVWLTAELIIDVLLMAAEIGGVAIAIRMLTLTGISHPMLVPAIGLAVWLVLWTCGFTVLEYGIGLLGLVTLCFVVSAWKLGPAPGDLARALVPTVPNHDRIRYIFIAIGIVGATVSPYLLNFYSSGCVEEKMNEKELMVDRVTAYVGTMFGGVVSMGVLITSAIVLQPLGVRVDSLDQAAPMLVPVFHDWAITLFGLSLGIGCLGAAIEIAANATFVFGQIGGWSWGLNRPRRDTARATIAGTVVLLLGLAIALLGVDPLQLTMISVAAIVIVMPIVILPFLVLMNDARLVKEYTNGAVLNIILAVLVVAGAIMAIVVVPLEIAGG
jgi:Mn2+/Fe2+ NRAMP family transporter